MLLFCFTSVGRARGQRSRALKPSHTHAQQNYQHWALFSFTLALKEVIYPYSMTARAWLATWVVAFAQTCTQRASLDQRLLEPTLALAQLRVCLHCNQAPYTNRTLVSQVLVVAARDVTTMMHAVAGSLQLATSNASKHLCGRHGGCFTLPHLTWAGCTQPAVGQRASQPGTDSSP